ncbi:hypothetical protein EB001_05660 [bacterium]|nr:hypothetical protein [bacterium]
MDKEILGLFAEPIGIYGLKREVSILEIDYINLCLQNKRNNENNFVSIETFVLEQKLLLNLKSFFINALHDFYETVLGETMKLKITQSWLTESLETQSHHTHWHPNSILSGVFYVRTSKNDSITFLKPSQNHLLTTTENKKIYNVFNSAKWTIPAIQNNLIIFRSNLVHEVSPVLSGRRISLAFNSFFAKNPGTIEELNYLPIY